MDNLEDLKGKLTKQQFIEYGLSQDTCPDEFDLKIFDDLSSCGTSLEFCKLCWEGAIKDIQFRRDLKDKLNIQYENVNDGIQIHNLKFQKDDRKILEDRIDNLENNSESTIAWKDIKKARKELI